MPQSIEAIIERQLGQWELNRRVPAGVVGATTTAAQPIITISRQHGSRGRDLAVRLAERFDYTLLHRDVIDRLSESAGHTRRLVEALDERSRSQLSHWCASMLAGKYFDESDYVAGLFKTAYSIARLGGVVVVGRGANFIIGPDAGVHLRVVAPLEERAGRLMCRGNLSKDDAIREIKTVDREREKFVRRLFHRSVGDALAYDVVINESGRSLDVMVDIATRVADEKIERLRGTKGP